MFNANEKKILARYLINDWDLDGSSESEELLQEAIDKAREADANGRPVRWTSTPSIEADELLKRVLSH